MNHENSTKYSIGDRVAMATPSWGIGLIEDEMVHDVDGQETQGWKISLRHGKIFLPFESANSGMRPLVSKEKALQLLTVLRDRNAAKDSRTSKERYEAFETSIVSMNADEMARILRDFYNLSGPFGTGDRKMIYELEEMLFKEISLVTGLPEGALEAEMSDYRDLTPAVSNKVSAEKPRTSWLDKIKNRLFKVNQ